MRGISSIDIHCHLDSLDYGEDLPLILARMEEKGVGAITIGTDLGSSKRAVKIAEENENIWACVGVHPSPASGRGAEGEVLEQEFEKLVQSPKVVGIGECGLDFFRTKPEELEKEKERQVELFKQQIDFALKYDKPLMLHCRNAYDEVLEILSEYKGAEGPEAVKLRGNCHFFAGNVEQAAKFVELGFSCSFTGVITFTQDYDEVIKSLPLECIMSETDAPFVAPVPYRGKRNEPTYVIEVVKKLAEIKGKTMEEMADIVMHNAQRLFSLTLLQ